MVGYGTERRLEPDQSQKQASSLAADDLLAAFERAPLPQLLVCPDDPLFTILAASDEYAKTMGFACLDLIKKSFPYLFPTLFPDDQLSLLASLRRVVATQVPDSLTVRSFWTARNTPVIGKDGRVACIVHSLEKQVQKPFDAFLVSLDDATRPLADPDEIVAIAARMLAEQLDADRCSYGTYQENSEFGRVKLQYVRPGAPSIDSGVYEIASFGSSVSAFLLDGVPFIVRDAESDSVTVDSVDTYRRLHIRAMVTIPLHRAGKLVASMTVTDCTRPRKWQPEEVDLVCSVANRCWESIERSRVMDELKASEQRLHLAQRSARIGSFDWFMKDDRILWSPELEALYGLPAGSFQGGVSHWRKHVLDSDAERVLAMIAQTAARREAECVYEFRVILPDGSHRWLRGRSEMFYDESGEPERMIGVNIDISAQKTAEADQQESLDRLQQQWHIFDTALSNSPDLTYTFDLEGRFTYANKKLCEVSQRTLKNTVGRTPAQLGYPAELAQRIHRQIRQVIETGQGVRDQTAFRLPTGEVREYEYLYAPVIGESGEVEAIAGATRDVTERKEAEEQLRKSEMRFRQLFDALPQLVWSATPEGYEDLYNKQWFEYTGVLQSDLTGDGSKIIHPQDLPLAAERWHHSLSTGEPYEIEYRCRRHDGQYRWFLARANPVLDEQGRVLRWFGTCTDIHDKKESETALLKAHRQLEEFSYVASHDLQEPLRMVNIYSQLLLRQVDVTQANIGQYAGFIRQGVKRMETLITDLLTFARTVQSQAEPSEADASQTADLAAALEEAQAVLCTRIQENDALITAASLPLVRGDTRQMAHVFQNLISNSLKYRKKDQRPELNVSAELHGTDWVVSFKDNGIGFEPQYAERIFGLFKRLHKDDYPGTGLGLAICQRLVERYGGRIWAEGRPGEGATFYVALPCA